MVLRGGHLLGCKSRCRIDIDQLAYHRIDECIFGIDQFHCLGQHPGKEGLGTLEFFPQQVVDLGEHLDLHVFVADLLDHPLCHLGMGLEQTLFEIAEAVGSPGVVVDQADHPPGARFVAGDDVERFHPHLFGEVALLQPFAGQVGKIERPQQGVVADYPAGVDIARQQRLPGCQADQPLVLVEDLGLLLLGVGGEYLQPLLAGPGGQGCRHQHRRQRELVDQSHRRLDHGEGRFPFFRLVDPPGQDHLLVVFAGRIDDGRGGVEEPAQAAALFGIGEVFDGEGFVVVGLG